MAVKATLKKMASELGVSVSTVSKALNNSSEISEPTRRRIVEYAKLRDYRPNMAGVNLKSQKTKAIGVIIPNILNPFFAKVFSGIENYAEGHGYKVLTCITKESLERESQALEMLSNGAIDGFIMSISGEAQKSGSLAHIQKMIHDGIPVVLFDRIADAISCDKVIVDDFASAQNATRKLLEIGCRKIALLSSIDNLSVSKLRGDGFHKVMEQSGCRAISVLSDCETAFDAMAENLFEDRAIDGIFALDEHASAFAMKKGLQAGRKIPEDLAIIGFADGLWSRRLTPSLSTVSQHGPEIGEAAAQLLIERLQNPKLSVRTIVINTELRNRDSTKR